MMGSLLILEGNADALRRQGHARVLDTIEKVVLPYVDGVTLRYVRAPITSMEDIERYVDAARVWNLRFDAVLLLAHGSFEGAEVAPGFSMSWSDIAGLLAPLKPRTILSISCKAAASGPAAAFFYGIPTLRAYGGAVTNMTADQGGIAALQLINAAFGKVPDASTSALATVFNAVDTGGLVFWRQRATFLASSDFDRMMSDIFAIVGNEAAGELRRRRRKGRLSPTRVTPIAPTRSTHRAACRRPRR